MNESDHHPCGWISLTIVLMWYISMNWISSMYSSFIHMVIFIHVISMLFTFSYFFLYQGSKYTLSIPIMWTSFIHVFQFHPCQNSLKSDKFDHVAQFHSRDQVHSNVSSMWSKFSWISSISLNCYFTPNTVLTSMPCMWENPISCQIYPISII
jgi:hypothetical protein